MTVNSRHFGPDGPEKLRSFGDLDFHNVLDRLAVPLSMNETANAADSLRDIGHIQEVLRFSQAFKTAMDKTD
jgi:hypothetical protein